MKTHNLEEIDYQRYTRKFTLTETEPNFLEIYSNEGLYFMQKIL